MTNIHDLFTASVQQQNVESLKKVQRVLLDDFEIEAIDWLIDYNDKYGCTPSMEVAERVPVAQPLLMKESIYKMEPLQATYESSLKWLTDRYVKRELATLDEHDNGGQGYPINRLLEIAKLANSISDIEPETFLNIDRDKLYSQDILEDGVFLGLPYIDQVTGGILPGEVALLGARTGIGKSLLVCFEAVSWARQGKRVMVVSAEMPAHQLTARMDAMLGGFNPRMFRDRTMRSKLQDHRRNVEMELEMIRDGGGDILFPQDSQLSIESIVTACRDQKPDVVIIDGLYLVKSQNNNKNAASWEQTKGVSNAVKQLAMELNIPIMTTSQFKRANKTEGFDLEDLAYSDSLAQDSDLVLAAAREQGSRIMTVQIIKCRSGETGGQIFVETDWDNMTVKEYQPTQPKLVLGGNGTKPLNIGGLNPLDAGYGTES